MEEIFKQLKKLQMIEPDKQSTERLRALIIATEKSIRTKRISMWDVILKNVEIGASFALAGILIITILGGFSAWRFLSPLKLSNLDTTGLKAEAQAVDIQIQLTNLDYDEIVGVMKSTSTQQQNTTIKVQNKISTPKITPSAATSTSDKTLSIEEALERLAE